MEALTIYRPNNSKSKLGSSFHESLDAAGPYDVTWPRSPDLDLEDSPSG
jgi:hypothetical protein